MVEIIPNPELHKMTEEQVWKLHPGELMNAVLICLGRKNLVDAFVVTGGDFVLIYGIKKWGYGSARECYERGGVRGVFKGWACSFSTGVTNDWLYYRETVEEAIMCAYVCRWIRDCKAMSAESTAVDSGG